MNAAGTFWSFRDQCRLRDMIYRRVSIDEIAAELGRSHEAITSKAWSMGISVRKARKYFRPSSSNAAELSDAERIALFADVPFDLAKIVVNEARKRDVPLSDLRGNSRDPKLVVCRRVISAIAKRSGFNFSEIGKALNRDHSTIRHHLVSKENSDFCGFVNHPTSSSESAGVNYLP